MKPSELFEGENSSLKKTYDEATKPLEEILEEFSKYFFTIFGANTIWTKPGEENVQTILDIHSFATKIITKSFQAGKDSMREEILNKLPDKQDERKRDNIKGSWLDNPRIQRAIGFNSCLDQVKNIIKNV
jgi:hypothetical protein